MKTEDAKDFLATHFAKNLLTNEEQKEVLHEIVTSYHFNDADFYKVLKRGFLLTPGIVYLAHLRGQEWLDACLVCSNFLTIRTAKLCWALSEDPSHFYTDCFKGCLNYEGETPTPNYLMAYAIDPKQTLERMSELGLWDEILEKIYHPISNKLSRIDKDLRDYLTSNAPAEWIKKNINVLS